MYSRTALVVTNPTQERVSSVVSVRPLNPKDKDDERRLRAYLAHPTTYRMYAGSRPKLARPQGLGITPGARSVFPGDGSEFRGDCWIAPALSSGEVSELVFRAALEPDQKVEMGESQLVVHLEPEETRQLFVSVEPRVGANELYAVLVEHRRPDGKLLSELPLFFLSPHDFFA